MSLKGTVWAPIGPSPMSEGGRRDNGMTTVVAVSPTNPNVLYQGTAAGGVWKSIDGGANWTPIFDRQPGMGIGEPYGIAVDPNDPSTVYVGTSRRVAGTGQEAGVFKSTDGGASFIALGSGFPAGNDGNGGQFGNHAINVIIVDPASSQTVYLASDNGVFTSADGGQNWAAAAGLSGDTQSLVLDLSTPAGNRTLWAGVRGQGVFQSTDGGANFTQLLSASTPAVSAALAGSTKGFSRVAVALAPPTAPPDPAGVQVIYAAIAGPYTLTGTPPDPLGIFLSTDGGANWTQQAAAGLPTVSYGGYCLHMAVDPASPGDGSNDTLFFGCRSQAKSTDSGASFSGIGVPHADTHTWTMVPQPPGNQTVVYVGTDGGIARSTDGGSTWTTLNAGGLQTGLIYNIDVKPDATASVTVSALQDNEVQTTSGAALPGWNATSGGDGWDVAYDGQTAGRVYSSSGFYSNPCTQVFVSGDDGVTWNGATPWTTTDAGCYLAPLATDPGNAGVVYASGSQNLWQSRDGGGTWRKIGSFPSTGAVAVSPVDGNNVVIALGPNVFASTNALAATVGPPSGVTFTDITRNLPGRAQRAVFDPNDPSTIYAVLGGFSGFPGGHVYRTTVTGTAWTDISPPLDVPFGAIAIDGTDSPPTLYVGTDLGVLRSVDDGATWTALDDLHFPRVPVYDLALNTDAKVLRAATYGRGVFEFAQPTGPVIAVNLQDDLNFGTVCDGPVYLTLQVFNVGVTDLLINSVQRLMGSSDFSVVPTPGTPLLLAPGEEIDFTVEFEPTTPGAFEQATIRIVSNDPNAPVVDLTASGVAGVPALELAIADSGDFGHVCVGSFVDRMLLIDNAGSCMLYVDQISSSSADFVVPEALPWPLAVAPGAALEVPLRFQPTAVGAHSAVITVDSNDPTSPATVTVTGQAPAPRLTVSIANRGSFGQVCVGRFRDEPLMLANSGRCPLTVSSITSSSPEFVVPEVLSYPLVIGPGDAAAVQIRFEPESFGAKSATLTIASDDPASPRVLSLTGDAPSGHLVVTGSAHFGAVPLGHRVERTISVCNTGRCDLHVTKVAFRHDHECRDDDDCHEHHQHHEHSDQCCCSFKLVSNPFPAVVRPGACLGVVIRFRPRCDRHDCCRLVIECDEPDQPERTIVVTGSLRATLRSALTCWAARELRELIDLDRER